MGRKSEREVEVVLSNTFFHCKTPSSNSEHLLLLLGYLSSVLLSLVKMHVCQKSSVLVYLFSE